MIIAKTQIQKIQKIQLKNQKRNGFAVPKIFYDFFVKLFFLISAF